MAVAVILPKLDEAMVTGKIVKWVKAEGDRVEKGESLVWIESEKVTFELEAEASGILSNVTAQAGDEVTIGTTIALILQPGEKAPEAKEPVIVAGGKVPLSLRGPEKAGSRVRDIMEMTGPPPMATRSEMRPAKAGAIPRLEALDICGPNPME